MRKSFRPQPGGILLERDLIPQRSFRLIFIPFVGIPSLRRIHGYSNRRFELEFKLWPTSSNHSGRLFFSHG